MAMYKAPDWFTKNVANPALGLLVKLGMSPAGAHLLAVRGRKSGELRITPVNPLDFEGGRYLVAPRGETQWVRNLRAAGEAELRVGSKRQTVRATEVPTEERPEIIRAYLARWGSMTASQFGVGKDANDEDLKRIAPDHPVFRISEGG